MNREAFDTAYLERLRARDPDTERHFYAYFGELIRIKVRARRRSDDVEDVRQETFLRVLRMLRTPEGLRDPGALGGFVNTVCNHVLQELGRAGRRHAVPAEEPPPAADPQADTAESRLIAEERFAAVRRTIDAMPARDRELLRAVFLEEREKAQVCRQLGVTREYLRVLLHRAKQQFRSQFLQRSSGTPGDVIVGPERARQSVG